MDDEGKSVLLPVAVRDADVLHFLGYPQGHVPTARTRGQIRALKDEARGLLEARGVYKHLPLSEAHEVGLEPIPAAGLVIGLVTVGPGIEQRATELADNGKSTAALILDSIGSAAVEEAADRLGALVTGHVQDESAPSLSCRISPGYGQWLIDAQVQLFERLPHVEIGVRLLPSLLMVPRKSISFAMWLGSDARPIAGLSGCDRCGLEHCQYRRTPERGEPTS